jgi:hypothetical protein
MIDLRIRNDRFIEAIMYWEGQFHQPYVGYNPVFGLTYDGHAINYTTGTSYLGSVLKISS